jgi:hypothetical protein
MEEQAKQETCKSRRLEPSAADFLFSLLYEPEGGGDMFFRNIGLSELHGAITQKVVPCTS